MNIWAKMMTALRGGVNEAGEAIVDSQALRILDQEIRDAAEELKRSKDSLANIIARQKLAAEKCKNLKKIVYKHPDTNEEVCTIDLSKTQLRELVPGFSPLEKFYLAKFIQEHISKNFA